MRDQNWTGQRTQGRDRTFTNPENLGQRECQENPGQIE